ncbi:hypothetical protein ALC62_12258, partial [Cyphomyrmex costatus]
RIMRRRLRDMLDPFALPENQFIGLYRINRDMTRGLIDALEPHLPLRRSPLAIPNELKVLCALNFYAQGSYQKAVGVDCRLSIAQSTVSTFLQEVTCAINDHLLSLKAMDTFSNDTTRDPTSCSEVYVYKE